VILLAAIIALVLQKLICLVLIILVLLSLPLALLLTLFTTVTSSLLTLVEIEENTLKTLEVNYGALGLPCNIIDTYNLTVYIVCDPDIPKESAKPILLYADTCHYKAMIRVANGCPKVDLSMFWEFIKKNSTLFVVGFVLFGMIIGVFGRPMWNTIVFLLFALTITGAFLVIFYEFVIPFDSPEWVLWLILIISVVFGVIAAFMVAKYQAAGFVLLGAWFGASFTIVFKNIILRAIISAFLVYKMWKRERVKSIILAAGLLVIPTIYTIWANEITFWVSLVGTCILCGVSAYFLKDLLVTLTTSFIGAYFIVRGLSIPIGGYPNEYEIYQQIRTGSLEVPLFITLVFKYIHSIRLSYIGLYYSVCICSGVFE
jgi:hypothetical protein